MKRGQRRASGRFHCHWEWTGYSAGELACGDGERRAGWRKIGGS